MTQLHLPDTPSTPPSDPRDHRRRQRRILHRLAQAHPDGEQRLVLASGERALYRRGVHKNRAHHLCELTPTPEAVRLQLLTADMIDPAATAALQRRPSHPDPWGRDHVPEDDPYHGS